jgi:hypothetical protein
VAEGVELTAGVTIVADLGAGTDEASVAWDVIDV